MQLQIKRSAGVLLCFSMLAVPMFAFANTTPWGYFEVIGALGAGNLRANDGSVGVTSSETDTLVQTNENSWKTVDAQLGAGYVYNFSSVQSSSLQLFPAIEPQLNLYYLNSNQGIRGNVLRFGDSAYNQLTYKIPVRSTRLMFDVALTLAKKSQTSIYVKAGVGNAWNQLVYSDVPSANAPADCVNLGLNLKATTRSRFAWELGAGILQDINDRASFSFEYLYTNFGRVSTSASGNSGGTSANSPATFSMYVQTLTFGLHYAI